MSLPKKNTRGIVVGNRKFRYRVSPWQDKTLHLIACPELSEKACTLNIYLPDDIYEPAAVERLISKAIKSGYNPDAGKSILFDWRN